MSGLYASFTNGRFGSKAATTILAAGVLSAVVAGGCAGSRSPETILLVSIDTLRADHLSVYGYDRATSPALGRFAERATLFENAYAQAPCTKPSLSA